MAKFDIITPKQFSKPCRYVNKVFLHCSASDNLDDDDPKVIEAWHLKRKPPFDEIGYHYYVNRCGEIFICRDNELIPAGQGGHNTGTIAICAGGLTKFPLIQLDAVKALCSEINKRYTRQITFHGHNEVSNRTCPVYDYKALLNLDDKGAMDMGELYEIC